MHNFEMHRQYSLPVYVALDGVDNRTVNVPMRQSILMKIKIMILMQHPFNGKAKSIPGASICCSQVASFINAEV